MLALPIAFAIVPALLLLWYLHSRDAYPEPPRVVWATFFRGVLSIPGVLIVVMPAGQLLTGITNPYEFGFAEGTLISEWRLALRLGRRLRAEQEQDRGAALGVAIAPPVPATVVTAARTFSLVGWVQVLSGGALLSSAGILVALLGIGMASGGSSGSITDVVLGGAALSVLPTVVGRWLFRRGIRSLNRAKSAVSF